MFYLGVSIKYSNKTFRGVVRILEIIIHLLWNVEGLS